MMQRSHSMALGSSSTTTGFHSSSNNSLSWSAMKGDCWGENADPNSNNNNDDLDAIERNGAEPGRKKFRARRHSFLGSTTTSLNRESSGSGTSTASSLTSSAHNLPSELGWLAPLESPPSSSKPPLGYSEDPAGGPLSVFSQASSPAAHSVASSSRKRSVCGSPISDQEDLFTLSGSSFSDARRTSRSRSRIFSAHSDEALPIAPSLLARELDSEGGGHSKRNRRDHDFGNRGVAAMDDDDEESSDDESAPDASHSPDSSFEVMATEKNAESPHAVIRRFSPSP